MCYRNQSIYNRHNVYSHVLLLFILVSLVTSKPFIKSFPEDMTVTEGNRVEFQVKVSGTPDPQLTWYHESTRLDNDYAHEISTDGTLVIATTETGQQQCWNGREEIKFPILLINSWLQWVML